MTTLSQQPKTSIQGLALCDISTSLPLFTGMMILEFVFNLK